MTTSADLTRLAFGRLNASLALPANPAMLIARMSSETLAYAPNVIESPELDPSGQVADSILVGSESSGNVEFPLTRHPWFHDILAAVFRNEWGVGNITGDSGGVFASRACTVDELIAGKDLIMYGVQKRFETPSQQSYHLFDKVAVGSLNLRVQSNEAIMGTVALVGGAMTPGVADIAGATYADPGSYGVFTAPKVTEVTLEGMSSTQCFNQLTLTFNSNLRGIPCIGVEGDKTKGLGRFAPMIEGTTYFESNEHVTALKAQTALKVTIVLADGAGNSYEFFYPRAKFVTAPVTTPGTNQDIMQPISLRAHYSSTYGYSCLVTRTLVP